MSELKTREICKSYRGRRVVHDVSIAVKQGEVVGLLGPNGAGKTTSFYMIVGLISPDSGTVLVDDKDITHLPMYKRAGRGIDLSTRQACAVGRNGHKALADGMKIRAVEIFSRPIHGHRERHTRQHPGKIRRRHLENARAAGHLQRREILGR